MNDLLGTIVQTLVQAAIKEVKDHFDTRINEQNEVISKLTAAVPAGEVVETTPPADDKKSDTKPAKNAKPAKSAKPAKADKAPKVDLKPLKAQAADLLEWLVDPEVADAADAVAALMAQFDVSSEPEISDDKYVEFYNALYDLADEHIDLEDTPRIEA